MSAAKASLNDHILLSYDDIAEADAGPEQSPSGLVNLGNKALQRADDIPDFKPIVIPQTTAKLINTFISPFARAYPPEILPLMKDTAFLKFIDELNEAFMASPVFQILGMAGGLMSFDPTGIAGFIGLGVQLGMGFASTANSYVRTKKYVKNVNQSTFRQLGLRVRILSTKKMTEEIAFPDDQRVNLPILPEYDDDWDPKAPNLDPRRRRLVALGDYVSDLDWDVAPMQIPDNFMKKLGAWQAKVQENRQRRKQTRSLRKLHKHETRVVTASGGGQSERASPATKHDVMRENAAHRLESRGNTKWAQKRYEKRMSKINRKEVVGKFKGRIGLTKEANAKRKLGMERRKYEWKERRVLQKVRWVVISKYDWASATKGEEFMAEEDVDVGIFEIDNDELSSNGILSSSGSDPSDSDDEVQGNKVFPEMRGGAS